ncbi:hypothetical protein MMC15_006627 [Xylographa vitiligo]|nr:hypothetical protein [Xylographa vitiligo]
MAPAKIPPMTTRQAKKAYRQASGPRLSTAEQKRMERKAVLLEREQKAKEKEKNRIANKKKRVEKQGKAKAQRKGAGVVEEGYVSPRQVRLAAYFVKIGERDGGEDCGKGVESPVEECVLPRPCSEKRVVGGGGGAQDLTIGIPSYLPPQELNFSDNDWVSFLPTNTQVERELSEGSAVAPTFVATEPGCSHSEHLSSQKATASACDLTENVSRRQEDVAQIPPFSTQDLEFSRDELTELMSPAEVSKALPSPRTTSSVRQLNISSSVNERAGPTHFSDHINNGRGRTPPTELPRKPAIPLHQSPSSRHSPHTISSKPAIASKSPAAENQTTRPSTHPATTDPSTRKSYVLADREAVPGHATHVLARAPPPAPSRTTPNPAFRNPATRAMRPPTRPPLRHSTGNAPRREWNQPASRASDDASKDPAHPSAENRTPIDVETPSAALDFGDAFLSTQELLDYVA